MSKPTDAQALLAALSDQLTTENIAEARRLGGIAHFERGALTDLIKDQAFCVEDIVTLLMSGWVVQADEIKRLNGRVAELENIRDQQCRAIDDIANQSLRLRSLLGSLLPDQEAVSSFDMLKNVAAGVDQDGPATT